MMLTVRSRISAGIAVVCLVVGLVLTAVLAGSVLASTANTSASPIRTVLTTGDAVAPVPSKAKWYSTANVESCVQSTLYDERQVGVVGEMRRVKGVKSMQLKFRLLRQYVGEKEYRRIGGLGLDEWIDVTSEADRSIRHLVISGVDTQAKYRVRIDFRWRGKKKVVARRTRFTNACLQNTPSPDLKATSVVKLNTLGVVSNYQYELTNAGGSEARNVRFLFSVDNDTVVERTVDSMLPGATVAATISAATCTVSAALSVDPGKKVWESNETNNVFTLPCTP
ncbi:MAG: hypothetical protein JHC87_03025 [Thermoleophilaceae bacterium]|nr:hypothetical protein [Thermoleophilaceae bacterium]